jgi:enoyl-CoA hydratase/carnithine racemase
MEPAIRITSHVVDVGAAVRVVTIANEARRNALTPTLLTSLAAAFAVTDDVRAVVLQGAGDTFSAGFDLRAIDDERSRGVDPIGAAADAISTCSVPVIAAVDGACFGGAVELLAACHVRMCAASTTFAVPAVRLGLVYPVGGLRRFRRVLGTNAERVLLIGRPFGAPQAAAWGLIHDVIGPDRNVRDAASALALDLAAAAPLAVRGTLEALRAIDGGARSDVVEAHRVAALGSADLREGTRAANEKRPPKFEGR